METNKITAGAVEWIGEPSCITRERPPRWVYGLHAAVGEILERAVVEDLSEGQVACEQWKLLAHPLNQLLRCGYTLAGKDCIVIDEAEARLTLQRNDPE